MDELFIAQSGRVYRGRQVTKMSFVVFSVFFDFVLKHVDGRRSAWPPKVSPCGRGFPTVYGGVPGHVLHRIVHPGPWRYPAFQPVVVPLFLSPRVSLVKVLLVHCGSASWKIYCGGGCHIGAKRKGMFASNARCCACRWKLTTASSGPLAGSR